MCYTEKAYWIRKHLGFETQEKLILCTDKSLLKGDYLIDDQIGSGQENFEGELITFGSEPTTDWIEVLKYIFKKEMIVDYLPKSFYKQAKMMEPTDELDEMFYKTPDK
jgi:hypothetical protein